MKVTLLFLAGIGIEEIMLLLVIPVFFGLIFLVFRSILLWYWKIDVIINNQQKQIELLTAMLKQNRDGNNSSNSEKAIV